MNIILAVGIFIGVRYSQPSTEKLTTTIGSVSPATPAEQVGLKTGDKILSVGGKNVSTWEECYSAIYQDDLGSDVTLDVERGGSHLTLVVPQALRIIDKDISSESFGAQPEHVHPSIDGVTSGDPAEKAGLKASDIIISIDSVPMASREALIRYIGAHAGKAIELERQTSDGHIVRTSVTPNDKGKIGIYPGLSYDGPVRMRQYSFIEAVPMGFHDLRVSTGLMAGAIKQLITGKASSGDFGGPIMIARVASRSARGGTASFLFFMAGLSLSLAFFNILPIPALDGGHLLFIIIEGIIRREVSTKVKIRIQQVGVTLLLALMAFVVYNDIRHF